MISKTKVSRELLAQNHLSDKIKEKIKELGKSNAIKTFFSGCMIK